MDDTITTIYCLCDDFLKTIHHRDDPQVRLSTAEVMTVPLVAATFFDGNIDKTRLFLHEYAYMPTMISKSHLNRRLHRIEPTLWRVLFELLARAFKERNDPEFHTYAVDSLPVPVCDNIRIRRCAESILWKKQMTRTLCRRRSPFAATSRANDATSTVCECIWW